MIKTCSKCKNTFKTAERFFNKRLQSIDGFMGYCRICEKETNKRKIYSLASNPVRKEKIARYGSSYRKARRLMALIAYGGENPLCSCCGEMERDFLCIDHINGGGNNHRKAIMKQGLDTYSWLARNNYPSGFQVLCHNCNMAKAFYGSCPHKKV